MSNQIPLNRTSVLKHCERLKVRLDSMQADYNFYCGLLERLDKIEDDLSDVPVQKDERMPDPKTQKGIIYSVVCQHPEGITQRQLLDITMKMGHEMKEGSASSLLSKLCKKDRLIRKRGKIYTPK